jgi:2-polyprenyl-3-methyl-5-hydroxy-6-metoxy-1,4-benzoquinol methylase
VYQVACRNAYDEHKIRQYPSAVGLDGDFAPSLHPCDVCGATAFRTLVSEVDIGSGRFWPLPIMQCSRCGFVMQNPRFERRFYEEYYNKYYRLHLFGATEPERDFVTDQIRRGERLFKFLAPRFSSAGTLLDVGCSAGGLMVPFKKRGWDVTGTDPDLAYVKFGRQKLGLRIEPVPAEDMTPPLSSVDLIIVTGSLEHVFDVNRVLSLCRTASRPDGHLLIEGRALNYGIQQERFSHTHRRYLTIATIELLMKKHGWTPLLSTAEPICGPTRPGGVYVLGRASAPLSHPEFQRSVQECGSLEAGRIASELRRVRGATP